MSIKTTFLRHFLLLCIGPAVVLIASLLGADTWDSFTGDTSSYGDLLKFGFFFMLSVPVFVVIRGILLAAQRVKKDKRWIALPIATLLFSLVIFPTMYFVNYWVSTYSDCQWAHEDNPAKCGY